MAKYLVLSTIFLALVLSFQNCAPNGALQDSPDDSLTPASSAGGSSELPPVQGIEVATQGSLQSKGGVWQRTPGQHVVLDLKGGEITEVDNPQSTTKYCLNENDLSTVKSILESSQLCEADRSASDDTVCTMNYQSPYAVLHTVDGEVIALGESRSGCDHGPDLCGASQDLMKAFVSSIVLNLKDRVCKP